MKAMSDKTGDRSRSRAGRARLVALLATALAIAGAGATPAGAEQPHRLSFTFLGPASAFSQEPRDLAVDTSSGPSAQDVYVVDGTREAVEKFDRDGRLLRTLPGLSSPTRLAVDGSGGPSAGDVYVLDSGFVKKFDPSGSRVPEWSLEFGAVKEIAVDPSGRLVVFAGDPSRFVILDDQGEALFEFPSELVPAGGLAASATAIFMPASNRPWLGGVIRKIGLDGSSLGQVGDRDDAIDVAFDQVHGDLYAAQRAGVITRNAPDSCSSSSCPALSAFGDGYLDPGMRARGVDVDDATGTVYATDEETSARWQVDAFRAPGTVPAVETGQGHRDRETTARLEGLVDPTGTGTVTSCRFELVEESNLAGGGFDQPSITSPCAPAPPYASATQVTGLPSRLDPAKAYRFRLLAANASGPAIGKGSTIGPIPSVSLKPVTEVYVGSARLGGLVDNDAGQVGVDACRFEYVERASYEHGGFADARALACKPPPPFSPHTSVPVGNEVTGLRPGTAYLARLVASNSEGGSQSPPQSFATPEEDFEDPFDLESLAPSRRVRCARRACVATLRATHRPRTWVSPRFPRTYGWVLTIRKGGDSLRHSRLRHGCRATFRGRGVRVRLNSCPRRFHLRYRGSGRLVVRWRVFANCRCANAPRRPGLEAADPGGRRAAASR